MREFIENILGGYKFLAACVLAVLILITSPFWIIPYAIYLKLKGEN